MNKRLREKLESWDLKSALLTVLFALVGLFLFFYFTDIRDRWRANEKDEFKGQTTGEILTIKKLERITQGRKGTQIFIDSYKVTYLYNINGREFSGVDIIPFTETNKKLLTAILIGGTNSICVVKFDIENPNKSLLIESK